MRCCKMLLAVLISLPAVISAQPAGWDIPKNIRPYYMAFLVNPGSRDTDPGQDLLKRHLSYIRAQTEAGRYMLAAPFQDRGRIAGILIIKAATSAEARTIADADPIVQSGNLKIQLHPMMSADLTSVRTEYGPKQ